jgi:thioredoxin reductase (NADPH)
MLNKNIDRILLDLNYFNPIIFMFSKIENIIILGSGCSGLTAAIYASRFNLFPLVIEGLNPMGQLTKSNNVENFPGFPNGIKGLSLMEKIYKQSKKFGVRFIRESIKKVDLFSNIKKLYSENRKFYTRGLIIATGSNPKFLKIRGEKEAIKEGKGISTCALCDGYFYRGKVVAVVGGGNTACEETLYLSKICKIVYLIHRRETLKASEILIKRLFKQKNIKIFWSCVIKKLYFGKNKFIRSLKIKKLTTNNFFEKKVKCLFIAIGNIPNTKFLRNKDNNLNKKILDKNQYIKTKPGTTKTYIEGVYAAGDCSDNFFRQAIFSSGKGCQAAIEFERWFKTKKF